jgi:hypothetical protein
MSSAILHKRAKNIYLCTKYIDDATVKEQRTQVLAEAAKIMNRVFRIYI